MENEIITYIYMYITHIYITENGQNLYREIIGDTTRRVTED